SLEIMKIKSLKLRNKDKKYLALFMNKENESIREVEVYAIDITEAVLQFDLLVQENEECTEVKLVEKS
ncbi:hypothetical protein ABTE98_19950, partial [Acinetobacter baumannii]